MSKFVSKKTDEAREVKKVLGEYKYGFSMPENNVYKAEKGLSEEVVEKISEIKDEDEWMKNFRKRSLDIFYKKEMPKWGADLSEINFDEIYYYVKPSNGQEKSWDDVPKEIKETYDRLGIPEAEKAHLGGIKAQYESEVVYGSLMERFKKQGIVFMGMDEALKEYPEMVKEHFGKLIPPTDNKFAALNSAVWSGGSFIYVPKGVKVDLPLQAYFRINSPKMGQFERTLIIVDEGAYVHYVEGCFLVGAMVETDKGEKRIEEVVVGDMVLTDKGRFRKVYALYKREYEGKVFEISYFGDLSRKLKVTEEHPLMVAERKKSEDGKDKFELEWVFAKNIKKGDYLVYPKKHIKSENNNLNELLRGGVGIKPLNAGKEGEEVIVTKDYVFYPVSEVLSKDVKRRVYNISVEEDETYVCEGVVSHNCTAPIYSVDSLHSAVVEIFVKKGARCRYTTIQNWSTNVYNLVTKRARVEEEGIMEWIDGNLGSKITMKYPSVVLVGRKAHGEILSIAVAGNGQHLDAGGKCIHMAEDTSSRIISKSISMKGGRSSYRGLINIMSGAKNSRSKVVCDALILDKESRSDTYPVNKIGEKESILEHEATVSKIGEEQLFYLMSRGFSEEEAEAMIVNGFIEEIVKELPMEYSVELNRLIALQMEGSVG